MSMNGFNIPIKITGNFREDNESRTVKSSIDDMIDLLVISPYGSFKADYYFGFVFQNSRFENSDEDERIGSKKIHGESFNKNNYAYDLKLAIEEYEPRLKSVQVDMGYDSITRKVTIEIIGRYEEDFTEKLYKKETSFFIWK